MIIHLITITRQQEINQKKMTKINIFKKKHDVESNVNFNDIK
jgi:hypothetical protein